MGGREHDTVTENLCGHRARSTQHTHSTRKVAQHMQRRPAVKATVSPVEEELLGGVCEARDPVKDGAEGESDEQDVGHLGDCVADCVRPHAVHVGRLCARGVRNTGSGGVRRGYGIRLRKRRRHRQIISDKKKNASPAIHSWQHKHSSMVISPSACV